MFEIKGHTHELLIFNTRKYWTEQIVTECCYGIIDYFECREFISDHELLGPTFVRFVEENYKCLLSILK